MIFGDLRRHRPVAAGAAADIGRGREARGEPGEIEEALTPGRQHREQLAGDDRLLADVLRIDQRCRAGHRDRLLE